MTQIAVPDDVIDLGVGQPQPSLLPLSQIQQSMQKALQEATHDSLQYGAERGDPKFLDALSQFLTKEMAKIGSTEPIPPSSLIATAGISSALSLLCSLLTTTNATILVEDPTYFLALKIFQNFQLNIIGVPMEEDGVNVTEMRRILTELKQKGTPPVFFYSIPVFQNPTGVTLSPIKRKEVVALAYEYDFLIFADEVYQLLYFDVTSPPPLPMSEFDPQGQRVISLGSFSKILAPGLRLGWIQTKNEEISQKIQSSGQILSGGGMNPFAALAVKEILQSGLQEEYLNSLRTIFRQRCSLLCDFLEQKFPKDSPVKFHRPLGGYFLWITLQEGTTSQLLAKSETKGTQGSGRRVKFQGGETFSANGLWRECLRFSFCFYPEKDLKEGITLFAQLFE